MNISNILFKLNSMISGGMIGLQSSSALASNVTNTVDATAMVGGVFSLITDFIVGWILKIVYYICAFVLNIIEFVQYVVSTLLGIGVNVEDFVVFDTRNPLIRFLTNDAVNRVFKLVAGVSIVLVIVFTIFSIAKSEYTYATTGDLDVTSKGRIFGRMLRSFFIMTIFPAFLLMSIIFVNAILAGFNDILKGGQNVTLAGQIFMTSAYQANNYRNYADRDVRLPILIDFEDPKALGQEKGYSAEQLADIYWDFQQQGEDLYNNFYTQNFPKFSETLGYKNNRIVNKNVYSDYERFVCTKEQYYVMADFIDYAVKNNITYYVKNMTDADITWKYVSDAVFSNNTLQITYTDTTNTNEGKPYTLIYSPSTEEISTPISSALTTISALLGIGDFENNTFNAMERKEDSINIVEWGTQKAYLQLSRDISNYIKDTSNASDFVGYLSTTDQLLLYEWARFDYNNSIDCSLTELATRGYELPVYKLEKREYQKSSNSYITTSTHYLVIINGRYYEVEKNETLTDDSGNLLYDEYNNPYYTIIPSSYGLGYQTVDAAEEMPTGAVVVEMPNGKELALSWVTNSFSDIILTKKNGTEAIDVGDTTIYKIYDDKVTKLARQISWPQKLINDLEVIYSDININNLIATGKWLEDFAKTVGATEGTEYTSSIETTIINPLGLILSELFLGNVNQTTIDGSMASLEFGSSFDEKTIDDLILSLLGEENYFDAKAQIEYLTEIFNTLFAPVLDELAFYEDFELLSGTDASTQLASYKAYLASILLSKSMANWMSQTALTMVDGSAFSADILAKYDLYKTTVSPNSNGTPSGVIDSNATRVAKQGYFLSYDLLCAISDQNEQNPTVTNYYYYKSSDATGETYKLAKVYNHYGDDSSTEVNECYLKSYYDEKLKQLEQDQIEPTDKDYPEYIETLRTYIYDGVNAFNGRLDLVLESSVAISISQKVMENSLFELKSDYAEIGNYLVYTTTNGSGYVETFYVAIKGYLPSGSDFESSIDTSDLSYFYNKAVDGLEKIFETICDGFEYDKDDSMKDNLNSWKNVAFANKSIKTNNNDGSQYSDFDSFEDLVSVLDEYIDSVESYYKNAIYYMVGDQSYKHNGDRKELVEDLQDFVDQMDRHYRRAQNKADVSDEAEDLMKEMLELLDEGLTSSEWRTFKTKLESLRVHREDHRRIRKFINAADEYIETQEVVDMLDKYYITYAINATSREDAENKLNVVVNNKHYEVQNNMPQGKFIEYVLGTEILDTLGYENVFVEDGYSGLVDEGGKSFALIREFLVDVGEISASLYQMTNLVNISGSGVDQIVIGQNVNNEDLAKVMLKSIVNNGYLQEDLLRAFFDITIEEVEAAVGNTEEEKTCAAACAKLEENPKDINNTLLNTVLSYLLLTEDNSSKPDFVDYSKLTLKEIRNMCVSFLENYSMQKGESAKQNQERYLTVLNLLCSDWQDRSGAGALRNSWAASRRENIENLKVNSQSIASILRLAGLENRPVSELVSAEYSIDFNTKIPDENNGDVFIICTFDNQTKQFVPFMMSNSKRPDASHLPVDEDNLNWYTKYGFDNPYTPAYSTVTESGEINEEDAFFPVIARGVITEDGYPTAIREVDGNIEYYREEIVVRDVNDIGLEQYFVSLEQIPVRHTAISSVVNLVTKVFAGESLIEKMAKKIPRFAVVADVSLCYGVDEVFETRSAGGKVGISFNFDRNVCLDMKYFYNLLDMNVIVLIIGTICMISALWKALWGITDRMFKVTVLYLIGPAAISTIALSGDSKDKEGNVSEGGATKYENWKTTIVKEVVSVFAYAIGFNILFIVAPIISEMVLFESNVAFAHLPLFGNVSIDFLNEIARLLFLISSAYLSSKAPALFASMSRTSDGFAEGEKAFTAVKDSLKEVSSYVSGQKMVDAKNNAIKSFKNSIPGYAIGASIASKVKKVGYKVAAKVGEEYLKANGVPPEVAKKACKAMEEAMCEEEDRKLQESQMSAEEIRNKRETEKGTKKLGGGSSEKGDTPKDGSDPKKPETPDGGDGSGAAAPKGDGSDNGSDGSDGSDDGSGGGDDDSEGGPDGGPEGSPEGGSGDDPESPEGAADSVGVEADSGMEAPDEDASATTEEETDDGVDTTTETTDTTKKSGAVDGGPKTSDGPKTPDAPPQ